MNTTTDPKEVSRTHIIKADLARDDPFLLTATFWKRFSVILSIVLSVASLILSAVASLSPGLTSDRLRAMTVSGIVINSISVTLSALTSLDWSSQATQDTKFAKQLTSVTHVHEGDLIRIVKKIDRELRGEGSGSDA